MGSVWREAKLPVEFPAKAEGDAEDVVIDVGAVRAPVHDDVPACKCARVAVAPGWDRRRAWQAVPAEGGRVQHIAVVVEDTLWRASHISH